MLCLLLFLAFSQPHALLIYICSELQHFWFGLWQPKNFPPYSAHIFYSNDKKKAILYSKGLLKKTLYLVADRGVYLQRMQRKQQIELSLIRVVDASLRQNPFTITIRYIKQMLFVWNHLHGNETNAFSFLRPSCIVAFG